jgi:hypothetical protein
MPQKEALKREDVEKINIKQTQDKKGKAKCMPDTKAKENINLKIKKPMTKD